MLARRERVEILNIERNGLASEHELPGALPSELRTSGSSTVLVGMWSSQPIVRLVRFAA